MWSSMPNLSFSEFKYSTDILKLLKTPRVGYLRLDVFNVRHGKFPTSIDIDLLLACSRPVEDLEVRIYLFARLLPIASPPLSILL